MTDRPSPTQIESSLDVLAYLETLTVNGRPSLSEPMRDHVAGVRRLLDNLLAARDFLAVLDSDTRLADRLEAWRADLEG